MIEVAKNHKELPTVFKLAVIAVEYADALLAELEKEGC